MSVSLPFPSCLFNPASPQSIIPDPNIQYIPKIKAWQDPRRALSLFPQCSNSAQVLRLWVPVLLCVCAYVCVCAVQSSLKWNIETLIMSYESWITLLQINVNTRLGNRDALQIYNYMESKHLLFSFFFLFHHSRFHSSCLLYIQSRFDFVILFMVAFRKRGVRLNKSVHSCKNTDTGCTWKNSLTHCIQVCTFIPKILLPAFLLVYLWWMELHSIWCLAEVITCPTNYDKTQFISTGLD